MEFAGAGTGSAENLGDQSDLLDCHVFSQTEGLYHTFFCLSSQGLRKETLFVVAVDQIAELFARESMEDCQDTWEDSLV